jgi:predicted O-methyltransferase YrrM
MNSAKLRSYLRKNPSLHKAARKLLPVYWFGQNVGRRYGFYKARFAGRPYFGGHMSASQGGGGRHVAMKALIERELSKRTEKEYRLLEVGSWAGHSAVLWASACKKAGKGKVFCIDSWGATDDGPKGMRDAVKNGRIFKLFLYNIAKSGLSEYVIPIKGSSDDLAPVLAPAFDLIYIDGDHRYTQFKKDLNHYSKLLKTGGVLCGDDLELQPDDVDRSLAEAHKEKDVIVDPRSGQVFHPGINMAVRETFGGRVSMWDGFWALRKTVTGWEKIEL